MCIRDRLLCARVLEDPQTLNLALLYSKIKLRRRHHRELDGKSLPGMSEISENIEFQFQL